MLWELLPADIWALSRALVSAQLKAEEVGSPRHLHNKYLFGSDKYSSGESGVSRRKIARE